MIRIDDNQLSSSHRSGWLLGPIVVLDNPADHSGEAITQASELAGAAMVDLKMVPTDSLIHEDLAVLATVMGAGLLVLPGSRLSAVENQQRLLEAVATARPVLVARTQFEGPVLVVAGSRGAGLGVMAIAADEARRLDRPLLVVHSDDPELDSMDRGILKASIQTIWQRCGVSAEITPSTAPHVSSLTCLAKSLKARLIILGSYDDSDPSKAPRQRLAMEIAKLSPCSVLLLPPPREEARWFVESPKVANGRSRIIPGPMETHRPENPMN